MSESNPHIEYLLPIEVDPACIPVLRQYPELLSILKALPEQIHKPGHFPGAHLTLHGCSPHDPEPSDHLTLSIYTPLGVYEAKERLDAFDHAWWLDHMHKWLGVDIAFC